MNSNSLFPRNSISPSQVSQSRFWNRVNRREQPPVSFIKRTPNFLFYPPIRFPRNEIKRLRFNEPMLDAGDVETIEDDDFVVETCITRTLPPALTLEHGLESIKVAVEELKSNPPISSEGFMRFQVVVPPSVKALTWFCCQPESSRVFPLFFLSKEVNNATYKSLNINRTRGVFGIGAAVSFKHSSSHASGQHRMIRRYLSNNSILIKIYGFVDIDFDTESSSMKHKADAFWFFIPQIELDEHEGVSILAATLAWGDPLCCTFEQAIHSFEMSLHQATFSLCATTVSCYSKWITSLKKLNLMEDTTAQMVHMNALSCLREDFRADPRELRAAPSSGQFFSRLTSTVSIANNMVNQASQVRYSIQDCTNINAVWAYLIVEECTRLGLTYFCVAPGSRSSPLALAASVHRLSTCIVCYDERSLAFHAIGYGKGSSVPAVIITSSGTAVSNLLPAVVEASQGFIPLLLLTADRPPELQDTGANQAINQVNHFGSFVRFFFSFPAPTDIIPARMVVTTIDSAVHWATSAPNGPVHINCPFREPLDDSPNKWLPSCLKGLDIWMANSEPFTKYMHMQHSYAVNNDTRGQMSEVLEVLREAKRGILLVGALNTEDEIWAVLLLAKKLLWPVVADILSGLRLRKLSSSFSEVEGSILFIDHLDHALLSNSIREWLQLDVVLQIGSRITSKRISHMLEESVPFTYILVDNHPCRNDPSHIVTHRIQSSVTQFTDCILKARFPNKRSQFSDWLRALNIMVAREISFQLQDECSLTEPYVAHTISEALSSDSALFIGNSMAIRDADMYGNSSENLAHGIADLVLSPDLPCQWIQVAGNRGASGIDGLLSTALGFAIGCQKRVLCVIGDVSFLHDTNGLALLNQRALRKPVTVVAINNRGGAIFSFLPIADRTPTRVLDQYFYTSHNISIEKLCVAHGVKHLLVKTKLDLQDALFASQLDEMDCVIEVESSINANAKFHSTLKQFACQAADHALRTLSRLSVPHHCWCEIHEMKFALYRIQLSDRPTSSYIEAEHHDFYREGFILSLTLEDGSVGYGEVAPLEIHKESMLDAEDQLRFLLHVLKGANISCMLPLLRGSFSSWIWSALGIPASSLFPSVRCGLEMAVLNAISVGQGCTLSSILNSQIEKEETIDRASSVQICALVDSGGSPEEIAYVATKLVEEGFTTIKLKVARCPDPTQDAEVIQEVRRKVGDQIKLRVDANRRWTYEEAMKFSNLVKSCDLQYVEEPVQDQDDIIKYCEESGLLVALDETLDDFQEDYLNLLRKYTHPGIVALVIKPSVVGGFENAALLARWAQQHGKMAVVSAAYESGLGLSTYIQFSSYLELQNADMSRKMNHKLGPPVAHGLGTYRWLKEDVMTEPLGISRNPCSGAVEASVVHSNRVLQNFQINQNTVCKTSAEEQVRRYQLTVDTEDFSYSVQVHEIGQTVNENVVLFLHGFLGNGEDWIPIMKGISGFARCVSIDLPGHGRTQNLSNKETSRNSTLSFEMIGDALFEVIQQISPGKVTLVGYSMGARIALYMALRMKNKIEGTVMVSGSPGLKDALARKIRSAKDDSRARALVAHGLELFVDNWYSGDLWKSLKSHPRFNQMKASRLLHADVNNLAKVLSDLSIGRQPSLWEELKECDTPIMHIVGEKDLKFKQIAHQMCHEIINGGKTKVDEHKTMYEVVEVPNCGHALHLENPLPVIRALRRFLTRMKKGSDS